MPDENPVQSLPEDGDWTFDLQEITKNVTIGSDKYILKEATEDAACIWRNKTLAGAKMVDGKLVGMGNAADAEPLLVQMSLWKATGKKDQVSLKTVRSWPSRVVKPMAEWVKRVSDLNDEEEKAEETAKNEQEDTPNS